jgi:predicted kinase
MPTCYIMVGLPGVGKSTYIRANLSNMVVHSSDQIIEDYAQSINSTYDDVFRDYIDEATKIFKQNVQDSIKNNESFIVDRTNLTKKSRRAILSSLPKKYSLKAIVIEVDDIIHTKYLNSRKTKTIPQSVIDNFKTIFEFPTTDEGFVDIIHIKKE